jgi:hypothetical protein
MRLVMVMVLEGLVALPLSASAQAEEEAATSEPNLQEPASAAESSGEEGGSRLERWCWESGLPVRSRQKTIAP